MKSVSFTRDVSNKPVTLRHAAASARLMVLPATLRALRSGKLPKADPVGVAKVAAIQAAKQTSLLIPYCHQVPIDGVRVTVTTGRNWIDVETAITAIWKTGVEMEALGSAVAGALTLYDMLKPIDQKLRISSVKLLQKTGGKSTHAGTGRGLRAAVLVVSDTVSAKRGKDVSGSYLVGKLREMKTAVPVYRVLPDDRKTISAALCEMTDKRKLNLVMTTGGTGVSPRDVTTEAVLGLIGKRLHAVEEAFSRYSQERFPRAMLSRCVAGTRKKTLIVALPGSPGAVKDGVNALFPALFHAFPVIRGERH